MANGKWVDDAEPGPEPPLAGPQGAGPDEDAGEEQAGTGRPVRMAPQPEDEWAFEGEEDVVDAQPPAPVMPPRPEDELEMAQGAPALQATGWTLFVLGGLIYLYGLWATANAVVRGDPDPEQLFQFGPIQTVVGVLGLAVAALGLVVAVVFTYLPARYREPLRPGTFEHRAALENVERSAHRTRLLVWAGVIVFVLGLALAAYPLKLTVDEGALWRLSVGDVGYNIHYWGYFLILVGTVLVIPLAMGLAPSERAARLARAHKQAERDAARPAVGELPASETAQAEPDS